MKKIDNYFGFIDNYYKTYSSHIDFYCYCY